jgi:hypothetical protein
MNNILEKYSKEQLTKFVTGNGDFDWPDDFKEWMKESMAYELYDRWINALSNEDEFDSLAKEVVELFLEMENK